MAPQPKMPPTFIGVPATAVIAGAFLSGTNHTSPESRRNLTMSSVLGMMFSLSAVTIPVLLDTNSDPSNLLSQWARLFRYGHNIMPTSAVATTGLYAYTAVRKRAASRPQWLYYAAAGAATVSIVPFTLLVMVRYSHCIGLQIWRSYRR
jgi:hypothetical protein